MSQDTPTLGEVIQGALEAGLDDLHVCMPGRVESYDRTTQKAQVKPLIKKAYTDEYGDRVAESLPVIPDVPVIFPGSGRFSQSWDLSSGDYVMLFFASASLDKWLSRGGEVDPIDDRRHTLTDAVAMPGIRPFNNPIPSTGVSAGSYVMQSDDKILLGGASATEPTFMADAFMSALDTLLAAVKTAVIAAGNTATGGAAIGATFQTAITAFDSAVAASGITAIVEVK